MGPIRTTWLLHIGCVSKAVRGRHPTKAHHPGLRKVSSWASDLLPCSPSTASSTVRCQTRGGFKDKFDNVDGWLAEEAFSSVILQSVNQVISLSWWHKGAGDKEREEGVNTEGTKKWVARPCGPSPE